MIIPLDERTRLVGADHSWQLERLRVVKGQERWRPYKWTHSVGHAVRLAVYDEIRAEPAQTLAEALEAVDRVVHKYEHAFDEAIEQLGERTDEKLRALS